MTNKTNPCSGPHRSVLVLGAVSAAFAGAAYTQDVPAEFFDVWSGNFTTRDSEFWEIADFTACIAGCSPATRQYLNDLLDDPANDERSVTELSGDAIAFARRELASKSTSQGLVIQEANTVANDTVLDCKPYGLVRQATNPIPMAIRPLGEHIEIQYEEWDLRRTIDMDGRNHPSGLTPTPLGHSVGSFDGDVLTVETAGIGAELYYSFVSGGGHSDEATVVERYVVRDNPKRLMLELTVTDPVTLNEPYVMEKIWLATPDVELVEDSCSDRPGVF